MKFYIDEMLPSLLLIALLIIIATEIMSRNETENLGIMVSAIYWPVIETLYNDF